MNMMPWLATYCFNANSSSYPNCKGTGSDAWPSRDWKNFDVNSVERMTYPFPILYDYNHFKKENNIPDPWNSGFVNTIPDAGANSLAGSDPFYDGNGNYIFGPGFLSFVLFSTGYVNSLPSYSEVRGSDRLKFAEDVFGTGTNSQFRYVSVGNRQRNGDLHGGPFESILGIY